MFNRLCKIIFIRHGSTIYNEENRLFDNEEYPPLNEAGKYEMESITDWLKNTTPKIDCIYTSSALRAIQSARVIAKSYKTGFEILDNLYERKAGVWGGLTFEQIEEKYPQELDQYHQNPFEFWPDGGESTKELNARVKKKIEEIIDNNKYKILAVVTHAGVIQAAIANALDIPPRNQSRIIIRTGSATQINYYEYGAGLIYSSYVP